MESDNGSSFDELGYNLKSRGMRLLNVAFVNAEKKSILTKVRLLTSEI